MLKILLIATFLTSFIGFSQILDTTFDGDGIVTNLISNNPSEDRMIDAVLQPDGKNVVQGAFYNTTLASILSAITRLNPNGSLDTSFGTNGVVENNDKVLLDMVLQPDGKIIKGGSYNNQFYITRLNTNGSLDTYFGANGVISTPINIYARLINC